MTWSEYLDNLVLRNPRLADREAVMKISVGEFLNRLRLAYRAGLESAADTWTAESETPDWIRAMFEGKIHE